MARGRKPRPKPAPQTFTAEDYQRALKEFVRLRANASETAGSAGKWAKDQVARYGLDATAFGFVAKLTRMEASKSQSALRGVINQAFLAGLFNQFDAFHDFADELEEIVEAIRANRPNAKQDEALKAIN